MKWSKIRGYNKRKAHLECGVVNMAKVGRPPKMQEHDIELLKEKFRQYIDETDIPIIVEFAYKNELDKRYLYERQEFSTLLKQCIQKKEAALEKGTLTGALNPAMAIFSLKQLGWRDKQELEHSGETTSNVSLSLLTTQELKNLAKTKQSST